MAGTVTIYRLRFLEEDIHDGEVPRDDVDTDVHEGLTAREACELIRSEGLTFEATGNDWAANPDGSYVSNYGTGERCEVSAHLSGFPDRVAAAIMCAVDGTPCPWQTSYGMPGSTLCGRLTPNGQPYCDAHMRDLAECYGGRANGVTWIRSGAGWRAVR